MLEGCQYSVTWQADVTRVTWTHKLCATCHLNLSVSHTLYSYWDVTRVTPDPSTCQPLVCARLAKVVGEVTRTLGVWDFGTSEEYGREIERPDGWSHVEDLRDLEVQSFG
jgi:hypothetical protein